VVNSNNLLMKRTHRWRSVRVFLLGWDPDRRGARFLLQVSHVDVWSDAGFKYLARYVARATMQCDSCKIWARYDEKPHRSISGCGSSTHGVLRTSALKQQLRAAHFVVAILTFLLFTCSPISQQTWVGTHGTWNAGWWTSPSWMALLWGTSVPTKR